MKINNKLIYILFASLLVFIGCKDEDNSIYITVDNVYSAVELGFTSKLTAKITGPGSKGIDTTIIWTCENEEYITLSEDGAVKAKKITTLKNPVKVRATLSNGQYATAVVRVIKPNPKVAGILLEEEYLFHINSMDTAITATILPDSLLYSYDVEWSTSDENIVSIIDSKVVGNNMSKVYISPKDKGTAKLTVTVGRHTATTLVTVDGKIDIGWEDEDAKYLIQKTLIFGESYQLKAKAEYEPFSEDAINALKFNWSVEGNGAIIENTSFNPSYVLLRNATVRAGYLPGKAEVVLACKNKEIRANFTIRDRWPIESLSFEYEKTEIETNESSAPEIKILPKKVYSDWAKLIKFTSSDESVAIVDEAGIVKGISGGEVDITMMVSNFSKTVRLKVKAIVDRVEIDSKRRTLMVGDTEIWKAKVHPISSQDAYPIIWSSSDDYIATVDPLTGEITATGNGVAKITVTVDGKESTKNVTVVPSISNINLSNSNLSFVGYEKAGSEIIIIMENSSVKYQLILPLNKLQNGSFNFNNGQLYFGHYKGYTLNDVSGTLVVSDFTDGKHLKIIGEILRESGEKLNVDIDIDAIDLLL